ncbi:uncharacterized protein BXZ73DRAFT_3478, partial [Epithele typhae]|uniref:uncharacterized protein n=1 Tax=Epithele typhae TaxID=378194 RepID=UPI0020088975
IGVTKMSCFCCYLLAEVITEQSSSSPSTAPVKIILPGTHSTVFPWCPPPGLPEDVLTKMVKRLMDALKRVLETAARVIPSNQTTPLKATIDL